MDRKMNDPKEKITQARESWEVRREDSARAKITSEGSQASVKKPDVKEANIVRGTGKRKKLRLKKSVRRTIGSLLLATSIVVGAVPTGYASADSDGVYQGSTVSKAHAKDPSYPASIEIDDIDDSGTSGTSIAPNLGEDGQVGGFPLVVSMNPDGTYNKTLTIGGRDYFEVNIYGFNDDKNPRPIYAIDKTYHKIKYYFEDNGNDNYIPYSGDSTPVKGELNFVTGYADPASPESEWWVYEGVAYEAERVEYDLFKNKSTTDKYGKKLYGKRIWIHPEITKYTVSFLYDNGEEYKTFSIYEGDTVTEPAKPDSKQYPGATWKSWRNADNKQVTDPIVGDTVFVADYDYPPDFTPTLFSTFSASPRLNLMMKSPDEDETLEQNTDSDGSVEETSETVTSTPTPTPTPTENPSVETTETPEELDSINIETNTESTENSSDGDINVPSSEEPDIVEEHTLEQADGGYGMTGILLGTPPATVKVIDNKWYKLAREGDPVYVCDNRAPINNLCDNSFEGTVNVKYVNFPSNLQNIGEKTFKGCINIESIDLGEGLVSIGTAAFQDCEGLTVVRYSDLSPLNTIGAKAFACSSLNTLSIGDSNVITIPKGVKTIGAAAFYKTKSAKIDVSKINQCDVGDCAFARCDNGEFKSVDLNYYDKSSVPIKNLDSVKYLFAECENLTSAIMPKGFTGKITYGTFAAKNDNCQFNTIEFLDGGGSFTDGEFDKYLITVKGPKPTAANNHLNPSGNGSSSYISSVDPTNDYVYQYTDNGLVYEISNKVSYTPDPDFFKEKKPSKLIKNKFIFEVVEPEYRLTKYFERNNDLADLEIGEKIGSRNGGDIPINSIGVPDISDTDPGLFENNSSIVHLQIDANVDHVYDRAFKNTQMTRMWAFVNNTMFHNSAFSNNSKLERVMFAYGGEVGSSIGNNCFAETPLLNNIDFYDDDIIDGDMTEFARFNKGSIASNAFLTEGRNKEITFKGPMPFEDLKEYMTNGEGIYAPYEFARDPASEISKQKIFTKYYSGNPWNLTAQYINQPFTREYTNPETGVTKTTLSFNDGEGAFCLTKYPNMYSNMLYDDIDHTLDSDPDVYDSVLKISGIPKDQRKGLQDACITFTKNIVIPKGIQYIDIAKTYRNGRTDDYYVFDESNNIYRSCPDPYYNVFKYNPDIESVVFEDGGVSDFPDRMFECARNLKKVDFKGDVTNLGHLPFFMPDTEVWYDKYAQYRPNSFPHSGPGEKPDGTPTRPGNTDNRSHLEEISFSIKETQDDEGNPKSGTKQNEQYSVSGGIIRSNDGSVTRVVQIAPSRGDIKHPHVKDESGSAEYVFGKPAISKEELSGVDEYAVYAARDCDALQSITFPDDGCDISYGCFMDCDRLSAVTMPNKFVNVKPKAFGDLTVLSITFPYESANVDPEAFESGEGDNGTNYPQVTIYAPKDDTKPYGVKEIYGSLDKIKNVGDRIFPIAQPITIYFVGGKDKTYETQSFTIKPEDDNKPSGRKYLVQLGDNLPEYNGIKPKPEDWDGEMQSSGAPIYVNIDQTLTANTVFTPDFDNNTVEIVFYNRYNGVDGDQYTIIDWPVDTKFTKEDLADLSIPSQKTYKGVKYTRNGDALEGDAIVNRTISSSKTVYIPYESEVTPTPTATPTPTGSPSSSSSSSGSSSSSSKSSSSSSKSSSSSSSSAYPVYVNSQDTLTPAGAAAPGAGSTVYIDESTGGGSGGGSGSGGKKGSGNANVISTTGGISDTSKISATVNGSSDNYIVKITQTQEADEMGLQALHNEYGEDISPIRYLCFDISLYDSTGTNKISPVPEGVSVTLTMPIPDDLAIYGGNAKICCTSGGVMEKMQPRFTVIDGVPCMTYTCTHFSPYMVWVDTNNLTAAGIADATPKTADGIHPKWFLCFGLAAIAIVMFLKKDPEEYLKKKAA